MKMQRFSPAKRFQSKTALRLGYIDLVSAAHGGVGHQVRGARHARRHHIVLKLRGQQGARLERLPATVEGANRGLTIAGRCRG